MAYPKLIKTVGAKFGKIGYHQVSRQHLFREPFVYGAKNPDNMELNGAKFREISHGRYDKRVQDELSSIGAWLVLSKTERFLGHKTSNQKPSEGRTIAFVANMPPHVCVNEILNSPVANRAFLANYSSADTGAFAPS